MKEKEKGEPMTNKLYNMPFSTVYPLYIAKVEKKGRSKNEVDQVIEWLTGYGQDALSQQIQNKVDFRTFFAEAPHLNPKRDLITGLICGIRVEEIDEPLMQNIRYLDKLIDELAKGKKMEKILRN